MSEFDARVDKIQVAYEGFWMVLSMSPSHEDIIDEPPPGERLE